MELNYSMNVLHRIGMNKHFFLEILRVHFFLDRILFAQCCHNAWFLFIYAFIFHAGLYFNEDILKHCVVFSHPMVFIIFCWTIIALVFQYYFFTAAKFFLFLFLSVYDLFFCWHIKPISDTNI